MIFPMNSFLPARMLRVRSGVKKDLMMPIPKTTKTSSSTTLGASYRKKDTLPPRWLEGDRPRMLKGNKIGHAL